MTLLLPTQRDIIIEIVCQHFGLSQKELRSKTRARPVSIPRQVAYYLIYKLTDSSRASIGHAFGKDHSTITWGLKAIEDDISSDPQFAATIKDLEGKCRKQLDLKN